MPDALGLDTVRLQTALSLGGSDGVEGAARILVRAAVAALLNASDPDIDYPLSAPQVIAQVISALASNDRSTMIDLAEELDMLNNIGCPS